MVWTARRLIHRALYTTFFQIAESNGVASEGQDERPVDISSSQPGVSLGMGELVDADGWTVGSAKRGGNQPSLPEEPNARKVSC
jgi:hypothetical protein